MTSLKRVPIPERYVGQAKEYKKNFLRAIAEFDDSLMEKYFDSNSNITEGNNVGS